MHHTTRNQPSFIKKTAAIGAASILAFITLTGCQQENKASLSEPETSYDLSSVRALGSYDVDGDDLYVSKESRERVRLTLTDATWSDLEVVSGTNTFTAALPNPDDTLDLKESKELCSWLSLPGITDNADFGSVKMVDDEGWSSKLTNSYDEHIGPSIACVDAEEGFDALDQVTADRMAEYEEYDVFPNVWIPRDEVIAG